ncbi:MAG: XRE family transcriptional regulator [Phycisphaerae bacterium]|nr:XRE family transcriptional regulator [Phycisphaerae bacterium]
MSLGEIIRHRREQLGLTQERLASAAGISKPYLSHIETGKAKNPPADRILRAMEKAMGLERGTLTRIAHLARTPSDVRAERELLEAEVTRLRGVLRELMRGHGRRGRGLNLAKLIPSPKAAGNTVAISAGRIVPVINRVSAGYPEHFTDLDYPPSVADEYIRCVDVHDSQAFAARVVGDSMEPVYHEGDVVVFSPNTPARNGDDCFVRFADEGGTTFKRFYRDDDATIRLQPLNNKYPAEVYDRQKIDGLWPAVLRIERVRRPPSHSP